MSTLNSSSVSNITDISECSRNPLIMLIWSVVSLICFFLGFPTCLMVLRELLQRQRLSNDFFMFNLTTIDTLFIVAIPIDILNAYLWNSVQFIWIDNFLDGLSICSRPFFMACMCADCYFAVVYPIMYMTKRNFTMIRKFTSVIIWLITIFFDLLKTFLNWKFTHVFNAAPLFIALPVIMFCDISVLKALKKPASSGNGNIHPQKKQAFHTIINSFVMTFIAYLPPVISFLVSGMITGRWKCITALFGFLLSTTGSVIMPILYLDSVGKLNKFKKLWRKYICGGNLFKLECF